MAGISRRKLILGGAAAAAVAWMRPGNAGGDYEPYFKALNRELQQQRISHPRLLLDLDRVDANIAELRKSIRAPKTYRIVVKSLPSMDLLRYIMQRSSSNALMAFHQPFLNQVARELPQADVLLGKPLPVAAVNSFYAQLGVSDMDPEKQLQWLVDTEVRLQEYQQLARARGLKLRINLELDIGLHRGGVASEAELLVMLGRIARDPGHLQLGGFMGYEAFIAKLPNQQGNLEKATDRYRALVQLGEEAFPELFSRPLTLNIGGSQTYRLYEDDSYFNDISAGSGLVMPTDFDMPTLASHQPASFIATPVLKKYDSVKISGVEAAAGLFAAWNPNRQQAFYLYGGNWQAEYENPPGLVRNPIWGHSSNQEMVNASRRVHLEVGDFVFLRPRQSEWVFLQFGDLLALRGGKLEYSWPAFSS